LVKYDKYKERVDFSQLDELLDGDEPTPQTKQPVSTIDPAMQNRINMLEFKVLESDFVVNNPDKAFIFKDTKMKENVESSAIKLIQAEMNEYGRVVSKPEEILGKAVDETITFVNKIRADGVKSENEKRKKIETSGADLGGGERPSKPSGDEDEDKPLSKEGYMDLQHKIHDATKTVVPPPKKSD